MLNTTGAGSILSEQKSRAAAEPIARNLFALCSLVAAAAVGLISFYMLLNGIPALLRIGVPELLFSSAWSPVSSDPSFGILFIIMTSVFGTALSVLIGAPVGIMTAVFLSETAPPKVVRFVRPAVELLAGIPSVVYGLLGMMALNPLMYRIELKLFRNSATHQFTGGANFLSAVLVLSLMILPTVIYVSETALKAVPKQQRSASLALGATPVQTIFRVVLPAARPGITAAVVLGTGRAIGEAMAVSLVSGSSVNLPLPFNSVRFLTTAIVSEMGYAQGLHRQALFAVGLVLFAFIIAVNLTLTRMIRKGKANDGR